MAVFSDENAAKDPLRSCLGGQLLPLCIIPLHTKSQTTLALGFFSREDTLGQVSAGILFLEK